MKYKITSEFGAIEPVREGIHTGFDLAMATGTKLRSVVDGWVVKVYDGSTSLGKGIKIKGLDGREYTYGHLDSVSVVPGEAVKLGTFIGKSGSTGNSTGPHLHFAVSEKGQYISPNEYKTALDNLSGDTPTFGDIGLSNSRAEMEFLNPPSCVQQETNWYDLKGKVDAAFDFKVCEQKQDFYAFLRAFLETVSDLSYSIALLGGGILIVLYVAGMTRAKKYFMVLQVLHILNRAMLGGLLR